MGTDLPHRNDKCESVAHARWRYTSLANAPLNYTGRVRNFPRTRTRRHLHLEDRPARERSALVNLFDGSRTPVRVKNSASKTWRRRGCGGSRRFIALRCGEDSTYTYIFACTHSHIHAHSHTVADLSVNRERPYESDRTRRGVESAAALLSFGRKIAA